MSIDTILTLTARGSTLESESDVCRRQIQTSKIDPGTVRVKICSVTVDPYHSF